MHVRITDVCISSNRHGSSLGRAQYSSHWSHKAAQGRAARLVVPFTAENSVHDARDLQCKVARACATNAPHNRQITDNGAFSVSVRVCFSKQAMSCSQALTARRICPRRSPSDCSPRTPATPGAKQFPPCAVSAESSQMQPSVPPATQPVEVVPQLTAQLPPVALDDAVVNEPCPNESVGPVKDDNIAHTFKMIKMRQQETHQTKKVQVIFDGPVHLSSPPFADLCVLYRLSEHC